MGQFSHLAHFSHLHNTPECSQTKYSWLQPWEGLGKAWALLWSSPSSTSRNRLFFPFIKLFPPLESTETLWLLFYASILLLPCITGTQLNMTQESSTDESRRKKHSLNLSKMTELPHQLAAAFRRRHESNITIQHIQKEIKGCRNNNDSRRKAQFEFSSCPRKKASLQHRSMTTSDHYQVWQTKFPFRINFIWK